MLELDSHCCVCVFFSHGSSKLEGLNSAVNKFARTWMGKKQNALMRLQGGTILYMVEVRIWLKVHAAWVFVAGLVFVCAYVPAAGSYLDGLLFLEGDEGLTCWIRLLTASKRWCVELHLHYLTGVVLWGPGLLAWLCGITIHCQTRSSNTLLKHAPQSNTFLTRPSNSGPRPACMDTVWVHCQTHCVGSLSNTLCGFTVKHTVWVHCQTHCVDSLFNTFLTSVTFCDVWHGIWVMRHVCRCLICATSRVICVIREIRVKCVIRVKRATSEMIYVTT
jgi:hypothetical protein